MPMSCLLLTLKWIKVTFDTQHCEIRKNTRRMREKTRQDDNREEKRDSKTKSSYEKIRGLTCGQIHFLRPVRHSGEPKKSVFSRGLGIFAFLRVEPMASPRTMRDTTFATPRNGKNIRSFCKWSSMWSNTFLQ